MQLRIAVLAACLLAVGLGSSAAYGQDQVLAEIYGRGVHAYFGGRLEEAESTLSEAINQGSKDPRCYYFRGLTLLRLGRLDEANADFMLGAKEEVKDVALSTLVSRSLARVQGGPRLLIEKARQAARIEHRAAQVARDKARYEEWQSNEKRMLRQPVEDTPPAKPEEKEPEEAEPEKPEADEPASDEPASDEPKEEPKNDKPEDDPFGDPKPAEPAKPAQEDPFG
jgi:tetratricopeptide (TPR) repeat protein